MRHFQATYISMFGVDSEVVFFCMIGSLLGDGVFVAIFSNTWMHEITLAALVGSGVIIMKLAVIIN